MSEVIVRNATYESNNLRPAFNILDGVLALEGQGPGMSSVPSELAVPQPLRFWFSFNGRSSHRQCAGCDP